MPIITAIALVNGWLSASILQRFRHNPAVTSAIGALAFAGLITGGADGSARVWDASGREILRLAGEPDSAYFDPPHLFDPDKEKLRDVQPGPSLTHSKSAQPHFPNDSRSNKRY